jgi:hypothetical protein
VAAHAQLPAGVGLEVGVGVSVYLHPAPFIVATDHIPERGAVGGGIRTPGPQTWTPWAPGPLKPDPGCVVLLLLLLLLLLCYCYCCCWMKPYSTRVYSWELKLKLKVKIKNKVKVG